jgi:hypothetical protein
MPGWNTKRILIAVRTYPVPAQKNIEVSCTAGVTQEGEWIRLFPVPWRHMDYDRRFLKYQWIDVNVVKATNDPRPESYKLNVDTINIVEHLSTVDQWRARKQIVFPLMRKSMCEIRRERDAGGFPTLGIFKPKEIKKLHIEPEETSEWTAQQLTNLDQTMLFHAGPSERLEKIPYKFKYEFRCDDPNCNGHKMSCTDWEMGQSYRSWREKYGDDWEAAFRQKYENEMINKLDTHFYVGTVHKHPKEWIIVGLFYPPPIVSRDLFD